MKTCLRLTVLLLLLTTAIFGAYAQSSPFTVLSNNADVANQKLYVEIMYENDACGDYKAQFRLATKTNPNGTRVAVDTFLNNWGTFETEAVRPWYSLARPTAGGYRLRFDISGYTAADSVRIWVDAYTLAYRCEGCAAGGSNAIFGPQDISPNCPYSGSDVLACY